MMVLLWYKIFLGGLLVVFLAAFVMDWLDICRKAKK